MRRGSSFTDLPVRQIYYFGTEGEQTGADPANRNSLLMASYNDISTVPFWKGLADADPSGVALRKAAHAQVAEVHNQRGLPEPYDHLYQDWREDPYGGGWHGWKAGVRYHEIMPKMRKPIEDEDVYVCGSAYSNMQGWVEGALQTAELMLEEHFDLKRPTWLDPSYSLGP